MSFIISEPPKIELPAVIKKEVDISLKKPILSSPEHKLDILESIAPKNNDLSETIQKLESVIQKTSNVDHFDDDSSDSTDSERRLVIEDDSQDSDNQIDMISNKNVVSTIAQAVTTSGTSIMAVATSAVTTPASVPISQLNNNSKDLVLTIKEKENKPTAIKQESIKKDEEILQKNISSNFPIISKFQSSIFGMKPSSIVFSDSSILSDAGVKPILDTLSPLKIENINQKTKIELNMPLIGGAVSSSSLSPPSSITVTALQTNTNSINSTVSSLITSSTASNITTNTANTLCTISSLKDEQTLNTENLNIHSESINLLLCEETIPGSPTPIRDTSIDIKPNLHPIESDIKPIPMDIECGPMPGGNITDVRTINTSLSSVSLPGSITTISTTSMKMMKNSSTSSGVGIISENQTPNSSPRDSISQDDSSEDLKKQIEQDSIDSAKKRRRTRKHSDCESSSFSSKRRRTNVNTSATMINTNNKRNGKKEIKFIIALKKVR